MGFGFFTYGFIVVPHGNVVGDGDAGGYVDGAESFELGLDSA